MNDSIPIFERNGRAVEELPDPFPNANPPPPPGEPPGDATAQRPRGWRGWGRWRWTFTIAGLLFLATIVWLVVTAPLGRALEPLPDPALLILDNRGAPIARRGWIKEAPVTIAELKPETPNAFIAIEDKRFRKHFGIDLVSIGRAFVTNVKAGGVRQGGSTLTQQLAKTSFLQNDRTLRRKAQEIIIAFWLEAWLTKDEILSRYLSSVYFGDGVYGLRAASEHYFGRPPERLTLAQSAMLAGLVQGPSRLAPTKHLDAAQKRSRLVLQAMADQGYVSAAAARSAKSARPVGQASSLPTGTYFADWVAAEAREVAPIDYGVTRVKTTLDSRLQRYAVRAVRRAGLPAGAQAAVVAMRPDGEVVAMVGGRDYAASPFNRATQASRQPGSAFKLFVYLAAVRAGYTADTMIDDSPIVIDGWSPRNADGQNRGRITLREAFQRSSNSATARLAQQVGMANVIRAARDLGIESRLDNEPSLALGTSGVTLLEMTRAYAAMAAGRFPVEATGIDKAQLPAPEGSLAGSLADFVSPQSRPLQTRRDWMPMLDLLWHSANRGTGQRAALWIPTYGKTGTTQDNRDAVFIGFAGNLVVGVWVGRDDNGSLGSVTGGTMPAKIWKSFMSSAISVDGRSGPTLPWSPPRAAPKPLPAPDTSLPDLSSIGEAVDDLLKSFGF